MTESKNVTELLQAWQAGDDAAQEQLFQLVYKELRRIAQNRLRGENHNHTLQATEIVHEIFPNLARQKQPWQNRSQFYALASECMRRYLVDYARTRLRQKRGGDNLRVSLSGAGQNELCHIENFDEVIAVNDSLDKLSELDPLQGLIIKHRYFGGLSREEIADLTGVSSATIDRAFRLAKAWLRRELAFQFSPFLLQTSQIRQPVHFINRFQAKDDNRFASQLRAIMPAELLERIDRDGYDGDDKTNELLPPLIEILNKRLLGDVIFTKNLIENLGFGEEIERFGNQTLTVSDSIKLNRKLLEAAFPNEFVKVF
ncbi:MAG: sigma-70 family RNA polymerase sigma factor [Pyrinomonadaceae bacterium]|nr:sigma-70 family RNA polymerase sigma factor [Pyrinomonadaceae bacterium]